MDERCPICGDPDCDECVEAAHDYEDGLWECYVNPVTFAEVEAEDLFQHNAGGVG